MVGPTNTFDKLFMLQGGELAWACVCATIEKQYNARFDMTASQEKEKGVKNDNATVNPFKRPQEQPEQSLRDRKEGQWADRESHRDGKKGRGRRARAEEIDGYRPDLPGNFDRGSRSVGGFHRVRQEGEVCIGVPTSDCPLHDGPLHH